MKPIVVFGAIAAIAIAMSFDSGINVIYPKPRVEHPVVNLPRKMRQGNWIGRNWEGSCVVASTISLLNWQGHPKLAKRLKRSYSGGQWYESWNRKMDAIGVRYASTYGRRNVKFLEQAIKTRRGAMVTVMGGDHMVCLVDLTPTKAAVLDNNYPGEIFWYDRDEFLREWFAASSWACTPIYTPTSPRIPQ